MPRRLADRPALVVVLHGCTQTADGYDLGSGWSCLADDHGFIALFPEQQRSNNPNLCFNWFSPADNRRDSGEALSIRQMIAVVVDAQDIDPARIFVTGLSAGGAMAATMLAAYPELFAGGAIIAGLPHGSASNVPQALEAMRGASKYNGRNLGDQVRAATSYAGPWPTVSVWHGTADATVHSDNADALVAQWLSVHDIEDQPATIETIAGHRHRLWRDKAGRFVVEDYRIANMGHGTPISTVGEEACGTAMAHMLEAGISSTRRMAGTWGLLADTTNKDRDIETKPSAHKQSFPDSDVPAAIGPRLERIYPAQGQSAEPAPSGVEKAIADALRAAGLMR